MKKIIPFLMAVVFTLCFGVFALAAKRCDGPTCNNFGAKDLKKYKPQCNPEEYSRENKDVSKCQACASAVDKAAQDLDKANDEKDKALQSHNQACDAAIAAKGDGSNGNQIFGDVSAPVAKGEADAKAKQCLDERKALRQKQGKEMKEQCKKAVSDCDGGGLSSGDSSKGDEIKKKCDDMQKKGEENAKKDEGKPPEMPQIPKPEDKPEDKKPEAKKPDAPQISKLDDGHSNSGLSIVPLSNKSVPEKREPASAFFGGQSKDFGSRGDIGTGNSNTSKGSGSNISPAGGGSAAGFADFSSGKGQEGALQNALSALGFTAEYNLAGGGGSGRGFQGLKSKGTDLDEISDIAKKAGKEASLNGADENSGNGNAKSVQSSAEDEFGKEETLFSVMNGKIRDLKRRGRI